MSGFIRSTPTDSAGEFAFNNVPFNPYHLSVTAEGFGSFAQDVDVRSNVPLAVKISLQVASSTTTVTVESGADLLETAPSAHTDVDRGLFDKLPLESQSSSVSSLVTLASPGVVADSKLRPWAGNNPPTMAQNAENVFALGAFQCDIGVLQNSLFRLQF